MMSKKKKIGIIIAIIVASFVVMGIVYALFSGQIEIKNKISTGSVKIDSLNLRLLKANGDTEDVLEPADIDTVLWTTKNTGTSGVLTRHTLEIYFTDEVNPDRSILYMFPANLKDDVILADYNRIKNGQEPEYLIAVSEKNTATNKYGIKYQFIGDRLNGSDGTEVSSEVNYNESEDTIIDESKATDDNNKTQDEIAFRLLVDPNLSYLLQGKNVSIKVTTEAMQYTDEGKDSWRVVDTEEINP